MSAPPPCYGEMFPDLSALQANAETPGKAFSVVVETLGVVPGRRSLRTKRNSWHECVNCPSYRHCYDFCMARLLLQTGLAVI
ncbi:MAG: hypothetical protein AB7O66_21695 [Limisphaerales bacterium]